MERLNTQIGKKEYLRKIKENGPGYILNEEEKKNVLDFYRSVQTRENLKPVESITSIEILMRGVEYYYTVCFGFKYEDDQELHPISIDILAGVKKTDHGHLRAAMRKSIRSQIDEFRTNNSPPLDMLEPEVDHEIPFAELADEFLNQYKGNKKQTAEQINAQMLNDEMNQEWTEYHKENAKLRWSPKKENRQNGSETAQKQRVKRKAN